MEKRKNESEKDIILYNNLKEKKEYSNKWCVKKTQNKFIQTILDKASKSKTGNRGEPDLIYLNENKNFLILIENKDTIQQHESKEGNKPKSYCVDGIKHYLSFFKEQELKNVDKITQKYLKNWKIVGIAVSGNIEDDYGHIITTFMLDKNEIKDMETKELLNENDYLAFFENSDMEKIIKNVSESSKKINNQLRSLDSQKRPVLLSGLMICLFTKGEKNDFKDGYINWEQKTIINNIPLTISRILQNEGIPKDKIEVLTNELSFIKTDQDLNNTTVLKDILQELDTNVIPLFNAKTNYDILGKFYEEFLKYAGVTNVKNGIVLTPNHITKLFTELVDVKNNDVIFDMCCGTGAFLISAMNKIIDEINKSHLQNKSELIKNIKTNQLIGFEKSSTMYALSISNMLFRGDGKSRIYNVDTFSKEAEEILLSLKKEGIIPSIGFINPPYGGQDNKEKPTKKEIQFLEKMLDSVSRFGVIIAPLSTFIKNENIRDRILSKHSLKYVINMPKDLFQPNASIHTAIAVFETNMPHNNKKVIFYDLEDDGLILSKHRGRTDALNKWTTRKNKLFKEIQNAVKYGDNLYLLEKNIGYKDEWVIQAHSKTNYSDLIMGDFIRTIKEHVIFLTKAKLNLLNKNIDELTLLEILEENKISNNSFNQNQTIINKKNKVNIKNWKEFVIGELFKNNNEMIRGRRLIEIDRVGGDCPYYSASYKDNGLTDMIGNPIFVEKNSLIYSTFGDCFYVDGEFTASDEITILKKDELTKYNGLFIATILKKNKYKYNFGRKAFANKFKNDVIKLPEKNGKPDWEAMTNYIKLLPYSSNLE
jgi:type I restriction enzyme M protein